MANASLPTETAKTVTIDEAKSQLDILLSKVNLGEEWLITDPSGQPVAKLVPAKPETLPPRKRWEAFGMLKGQIEVAPDFDEPIEDMKPYME